MGYIGVYIGIMEKKIENYYNGLYRVYIRVIFGICWDTGKEKWKGLFRV